MPYCTRADLDARFGAEEIGDLLDNENAGSEATGRLNGAVADASAMIDGYLAGRYAVPLADPVPTLISAIACDLTRYRLWDDRAPQEIRKRYDDALRQLSDISKGLITLPGAETLTPAADAGGGVEFVETERVFTMSGTQGYY